MSIIVDYMKFTYLGTYIWNHYFNCFIVLIIYKFLLFDTKFNLEVLFNETK